MWCVSMYVDCLGSGWFPFFTVQSRWPVPDVVHCLVLRSVYKAWSFLHMKGLPIFKWCIWIMLWLLQNLFGHDYGLFDNGFCWLDIGFMEDLHFSNPYMVSKTCILQKQQVLLSFKHTVQFIHYDDVYIYYLHFGLILLMMEHDSGDILARYL